MHRNIDIDDEMLKDERSKVLEASIKWCVCENGDIKAICGINATFTTQANFKIDFYRIAIFFKRGGAKWQKSRWQSTAQGESGFV